MKPLIIIPARMASTRLPGKPLADIGGAPMIVRCAQRASAANLGPVYIACCEPEVRDAVTASGYHAVMADPDLPSGTDRIKSALEQIDPEGEFDTIINVQGDLPTLDPAILQTAIALMDNPDVDIATLAVATTDLDDIANPNVVKAVIAFDTDTSGRALYFTRASAPSGDGPVYHHVGLYVYRRKALMQFCELAPSPLETRERLEQLRALEAGMRIDVALIDHAPHGVDTPADLERARAQYRLNEHETSK